MSTQLFAQGAGRLVGFWPDVDQRQRIFFYEVDIHVADIKWRWYRERDQLHKRNEKRYHTNKAMPKRDMPIVIAGAGPAGSSLAIRLRAQNMPVVIVERYRFPRQKLCGEFISPECLAHFDELGVRDRDALVRRRSHFRNKIF